MSDLVLFVTTAVILHYLKVETQTSLLIMIPLFIFNEFSKTQTLKLYNVNDSKGLNESLVLDAKLNGVRTLFMLDTGYAAAPVISSSYLAIQNQCQRGNVLKRYQKSLQLLRNVNDNKRYSAIDKLISNRSCQSYTSGCSMNLAGIGSTIRQQADMLLCNPLQFKNTWGFYITPTSSSKPKADVLVTNTLHHSVHILTCDYLIHSCPCLIKMYHQTLDLFISPIVVKMLSYSFSFVQTAMYGGAFVVPITVGGDHVIHCTVDTGSPGPISMGKRAMEKLKSCMRPSKKKVMQAGVNGEKICSDILYTSAQIGDIEFE